MKVTLVIISLGLYLVVPEALGLVCEYSRSRNTIRCDGVICRTKSPSKEYMKLPIGFYRVGLFYNRGTVPWFNLYPKRSSGGYWDYHTRSPDHWCEGGFALHSGTISKGCITVGSDPCFNKLKKIITAHMTVTVQVKECLWCLCSNCWKGEATVARILYDGVWVRSFT